MKSMRPESEEGIPLTGIEQTGNYIKGLPRQPETGMLTRRQPSPTKQCATSKLLPFVPL